MDIQNEQTYDSAFWAGVLNLPWYLVPLVNEVFGEHFTRNAVVELHPGKQADQMPDKSFEKREVDTLATLTENTVSKQYHFEVETRANKGIFIRIGEYDLSIARHNLEWTERGIETQLPQSAVIFLTGAENMPDKVSMFYKTALGEVESVVPVLRVKDYTINNLFEKRLLLLIPFYGFNFKDRFCQMEKDGIGEIKSAFDEIHNRLVALADTGEIDEAQRSQIIDWMARVMEKLTVKYGRVSEGVKELMVGYIQKTRTDEILDKGRNEGEQNAKVQALRSLMETMKWTIEQAMDALKIPSDERSMYAGLVNGK